MKLSQIIENTAILSINGSIDIDISDIVYDSRKVTKNCIFVCLKGTNVDGNDYVEDAIKNGASAIITENDINIQEITTIRSKNTRKTLAEISANFFGNPAKKITTIGITGTKGKTTTSFMIKSIIESSGVKCGLIGTMGAIYGGEIVKLENTTPESYEIQKHLAKMVDLGYKYAVMEASSIGLKAHRLEGFKFDIGLFTNFSRDHIGGAEHKSMEEYLACKSLLFRKCKTGLINCDDEFADKIIKDHTCKVYTFGQKNTSDYKMENVNLTNDHKNIGVKLKISGKLKISDLTVSVPGKFNAYNALAAASACDTLGIDSRYIIKGLMDVKIKGRVESVPCPGDFSVFIDYAHNAVSMESVLSTLRQYSPSRLVVLFGAGGNRPKIRRYEMGEVAGKLADLSIITSDNPRNENPMDIIKDIEIGINKTDGKYTIIPDRKEAIKYAVDNAQKGDIILLAGKGHEDYQEINGIKYPMDERIIIREIFEK